MACGGEDASVCRGARRNRRRLPARTKWECGESIYGIDNNRESAASPCDGTGGTRCRQTRRRTRGAACRAGKCRDRWNPIHSWVLIGEHFEGQSRAACYRARFCGGSAVAQQCAAQQLHNSARLSGCTAVHGSAVARNRDCKERRPASEHQLECKLKLARVLGAGDAAEIRGEGGAVRNIEVGVIEKVVCFRAKL